MMEIYQQLIDFLRKYPKVAVAFSGGVDSTLVLRTALDALGRENVLAVTARSTLHCSGEGDEARDAAARMGALQEELILDPLVIDEVKSNSPLRCYYCKRFLFGAMQECAARQGIDVLLDGTNAQDLDMYRPGRRAAAELGIISPLAELGIDKVKIRKILQKLGLPEGNKPSNSCLATRIPYHTQLDRETLKRIDQAECVLHQHGYLICRVRVHGDLARIEVKRDDIHRLATDNEVLKRVKEIGFTYICLDLEGYRSGSFDTDAVIGAVCETNEKMTP